MASLSEGLKEVESDRAKLKITAKFRSQESGVWSKKGFMSGF